jgi:hypothetical protein
MSIYIKSEIPFWLFWASLTYNPPQTYMCVFDEQAEKEFLGLNILF